MSKQKFSETRPRVLLKGLVYKVVEDKLHRPLIEGKELILITPYFETVYSGLEGVPARTDSEGFIVSTFFAKVEGAAASGFPLSHVKLRPIRGRQECECRGLTALHYAGDIKCKEEPWNEAPISHK